MKRTQYANSIAEAGLRAVLGLFPLFTGFSGYGAITAAKFWFMAGTAAVLLLGLGLCRVPRRLQAGDWAVLVYLGLCALSALLSPWFPRTLLGCGRWDGLVTRLCCGALYLAFSLYARPGPRHLALFLGSMSLCCLVALGQRFGWDPLHLYPNGLTYADGGTLYTGRFLGTIGNVDLLAGALCLMVPAGGTAFLWVRGRRRWLYLTAAIIGGVTLVLADVSAGLVGLLVWLFLLPPLMARSRRTRRLLLSAELGTGLAGLALLRVWPGSSGILWEARQLLRGQAEDSFGSGRWGIWRQVLALVRERPLLGGGPGTLSQRVDIRYSRYVPETGVTLYSYVDSAHNDYLGILADTGLAGLSVWLTALALIVRPLLRRPDSPGAAVLLTALAAYGAQAMFGLDLCLTAPLLWTALGLASALARCADAPEEEQRTCVEKAGPSRKRK